MIAFHSYAQFGEDQTLFRIFNEKCSGVCVEVGAFDGRTGSNTLAFEEIGWGTVLIEPIPALADKIRQDRPRALLFECVVGPKSGEVILSIPTGSETLSSVSSSPSQIHRSINSSNIIEKIAVSQRTLDSVLEEAGLNFIDFITIDVEGYEISVLEGFDLERWRPRIVILEDNSSGTSIDVALFMEARGYSRFHSSGCNDWFCRKEDPLRTRYAVFRTEFIKTLKAAKRVALNFFRRSFDLKI